MSVFFFSERLMQFVSSKEGDIAKLEAALKRKGIQIQGLESALEQKVSDTAHGFSRFYCVIVIKMVSLFYLFWANTLFKTAAPQSCTPKHIVSFCLSQPHAVFLSLCLSISSNENQLKVFFKNLTKVSGMGISYSNQSF